MRIELATVQAVNVRDYTVDVLTEQNSHPLIGVPILTPLNHPDHMGGINFLPEVGSSCYICFPDDGTYFVLGFFIKAGVVDPLVSPGPNFTAKREPLEPGDICMATVDGNQVVLRRGGLVQIGSNGLCQRLYIPGRNIIRDYFQRYHAISPIGEIDWGHAQLVKEENLADGNTSVAVRYNIRRILQEDVSTKPYTLEIRFGVLTEKNLDSDTDEKNHLFANPGFKAQEGTGVSNSAEGTLSFTIFDHNDNANKVVYAFQLSRQGDMFLMSDGHVHMEVAQTLYVYAGDHITIETANNKNIVLKVGGGGKLYLGSGSASEDAILGNQLRTQLNALIDTFNSHTHGTGVGPSGVPAPQASSITAAVLSTHVKVAG